MATSVITNTTQIKELADGSTDGTRMGKTSAALIGFHGATPISQRAAAILTATNSIFAITGASYVANTSTTVSGLFGFNSTGMVLLIDAINELRDGLVALGLHKGGA